ncbi:hypothetical protein [Acholeplasma hippikon]|uniref:Uncharacterized protein n=1 Tax=Acholeplasma hippikon TaxID=264636 RepID=A0A449BIG4_9MOLU|nr:hypothetical protein [Acholeplasma hippikon]VEU82251.1 Uncharacterised protein [Acholeplasma hippikon]
MDKFINVYYRYFKFEAILFGLITLGLLGLTIVMFVVPGLNQMVFMKILFVLATLLGVIATTRRAIQAINHKYVNEDTIQKIELSLGHLDFLGIVRYSFIFDNKSHYTKKHFSTKIYAKLDKHEFEQIVFYAAYNKKATSVVLLEKR